MIRAFLVGGAVGAFAAAYLIGWWLSATPERATPERSVTYSYSTN